MSGPIIVQNDADLQVITDSDKFGFFLDNLGLPKENVIASTSQRNIIASNLPSFINQLPIDIKKEAKYLSKFTAASAIGLFDAALNYVWNEVVLNLRKKVILYGVDLFYDAAIGGKNREFFTDENDLDGIKDIVLVDTCKKLELISDIVHKKITNILIMRNELAASHPNVAAIGAYELMGWLETCISEVLRDELSESAIKTRQIVDNLKKAASVLDPTSITAFGDSIKFLSSSHINNLLITLFGMFVSTDDAVLLKNISSLIKVVWEGASERAKLTIGETINSYRVNLHQDKVDRGVEFLRIVDGLRYENISAKTLKLSELARGLLTAHHGWDNYYHEPPIAKEILAYIKKAGDIPTEVAHELITIILKCRIGNGRSYCRGVSPAAQDLYDKFLAILDDSQIVIALMSIFKSEVLSFVSNQHCLTHLLSALSILKQNVINERLSEVVDYFLSHPNDIQSFSRNSDFCDLCKPFFVFNRQNSNMT